MRASFALIATLTIAAAAPAMAGWEQDISAFDRQRLATIDQSRAEALAEAEAGGNTAELRTIRAVAKAAAGDISERELTGNWRCRVLKMGGMTPTKVYSWFNCRVKHTRQGLFFEKTGGAQRWSGYVVRHDGQGWVLLGAMTSGTDRQMPYSGGTPGAGAQTTSNDAVGLIAKIGRNHARIDFPYPAVESHFDVIELKR